MILPLWDENPFDKPRLPWVSWSLILVNVGVFAWVSSLPDDAVGPLVRRFAILPPAVLHPLASGNPWAPLSLFTAAFMHANWLHLLGNMLFIWIFADDIEEVLGRWRFLGFYLASAALSGLFYALVSADSPSPELGASGAIAGVMVAYLMYEPCKKVLTLIGWMIVRIDAYWLIGIWAALQIVLALTDDDNGVAYAAHIGGLIAGAALFPLLRPKDIELFTCFSPPPPPPDSAPTPELSAPV